MTLDELRSSRRLLIPADEARLLLGPDAPSRSAWYEAIRAGQVDGVHRLGRQLFVAVPAFLNWLGIDAEVDRADSGGSKTEGSVPP